MTQSIQMTSQSNIVRHATDEETIRFATADSRFGTVLVARSVTGICAILLGDDAAALEADLRQRFPAADLRPGGADVKQTLAAVIAFVEQPRRTLDLPLDLRGTDFQRKVWQALQDIPAGSTASYADIARQIGSPRAVRAVARACAANALAVAVPCHRVLRQDGALSGYRWGVARKQALLQAEMRR